MGHIEKTIRTNRHCRVCGCIPCIDGTLCEGDMFPMDFVIRREMQESFHLPKLLKAVDEIVRHPKYQPQPRSPKPRR